MKPEDYGSHSGIKKKRKALTRRRRYLIFFSKDTTQWMTRNVKTYSRFFSEKDLLTKIIINKLKIKGLVILNNKRIIFIQTVM